MQKLFSFISRLSKLLPEYYYLKHFIIALLIALGLMSENGFPLVGTLLSIINVIFYPFSRYVYSSISHMLPWEDSWFNEIIATLCCYGGALFIAPIGIGYRLYKNENMEEKQV
ncbi:hypothetical protein [Endozoicomonas ascidiicola]|uniref:hypothetical protein n=1 Tax=Endozoicomonas ascidiicola TaxID=1698521 RepID=UPI00082E4A0A|nr:hypothetical protein [Endozoicomonas ascidiicola]USN27001.1 hypothetical protein [synthetic construct]